MSGPDEFPGAAHDKWKTTPPDEKEPCSICELTNSPQALCDHTDEDVESIAAEERLDMEKEG